MLRHLFNHWRCDCMSMMMAGHVGSGHVLVVDLLGWTVRQELNITEGCSWFQMDIRNVKLLDRLGSRVVQWMLMLLLL